MATPDDFVPVAITSRSGADESVHFGAVVAIGPSGDVEFAVGNPTASVFPRSANKPMQAVAMVRAGLALPPDLLALVCASHDGLPMHTDAAIRILSTAGLDPTALANSASLPLDPDAARAVLVAGGGPTPLLMNCSGKHSGMVATCVHNAWHHDASYLDFDHPLQLAITDTIDELSGEPHAHIGVDGCGAPAHMFSLLGLARSFAAIATGRAGVAGDEVYEAMTTRDVTTLMRSVRGLMAKDGADGVYAAALPDGRAVAVKIADGGDRARPPVMVAALRALGIDLGAAAPLLEERIMGHGRPGGVVRAVAP